MNVKLRVLSAGVLFFIGHTVTAQKKKDDSTKVEEIKEVVILGYNRTATKPKDVTASTTVTSEKFENRPTTSFLNSLQGEAPGLAVNSTSGSPGSGKIDIILRGVGSISAGSEPLYVIDGVVSNSTQFRNLNDSDIESASVLRDAAATAIYGNRSANGVIVITTKKGKYNSPMTFNYSASTGINVLPKTKYNMMNTQEALKLTRFYGNGLGVGMTDEQIANYPIQTDWREVFFNPGVTQKHDLSLRVGGENVNLYSSLGYMDVQGIVPTSDFKRFTLRNNLNGRNESGRFNYGIQSAISYSVRHQLDEETNTNIRNNSIQNPLHGATAGLPYIKSGQFATGQDLYNTIGTDFNGGNNIFVLEDILKGNLPNERTETGILLNFNTSYKLTDELTLSNKAGVDYKYSETNFARAPWSYLAIAVAQSNKTTNMPNPFPGFEDFAKSREFNFNNVVSLLYNKKINDHTFDVGMYFDYVKSHFNSTSQRRTGLNPLNWVFGAGTGYVSPVYFNTTTSAPEVWYVPTASAGEINAGTLAYFLTLDYDYNSKYGFSGLIRRDATYRFVDDNKWGTFWSVAGRWNIDKEDFMADSGFNMLKLRASYGVTGNQNIIATSLGSNPLLGTPNLVRETYLTGTGYDNITGALGFGGLTNPSVQWEEYNLANIGLDIKTLNNRLDMRFDVYDKTTNKVYNDIYLSYITGSSTIKGNNGKIQNRGVEAQISYDLWRGQNGKFSIYGNGSYNKSKIINITKDDVTGQIRNVSGNQMYEWWFAPYIGVNPDNGNLLFLDINNNPTETLTENDYRPTGKNMYPKWTGGFGFKSEYKRFYLDTHFSFQAGAWKYDNAMAWVYDPVSIGEWNQSSDLLDAWTPQNTGGSMPSLFATNYASESISDRWLKDASFVRLKTVSLGYNVPEHLLKGTFVKALKVFVSGENVYTWTKWKGYDPEPNFSYSLSVYPNMRTFSFGANIDF